MSDVIRDLGQGLVLRRGRAADAEALAAFNADCLVRTHEVRALLTALFPKQASNVWALA